MRLLACPAQLSYSPRNGQRVDRSGGTTMTPFRIACAAGAAVLGAPLFATGAAAQAPPPSSLTEKLNAYVGCINRLSERSYDSRKRYFSWVSKSGPTGRERIIYGTYTIYDTSDCRRNVEKANALEPRDSDRK